VGLHRRSIAHPYTNEEQDHAHGLNDEATKSFGQSTRGKTLGTGLRRRTAGWRSASRFPRRNRALRISCISHVPRKRRVSRSRRFPTISIHGRRSRATAHLASCRLSAFRVSLELADPVGPVESGRPRTRRSSARAAGEGASRLSRRACSVASKIRVGPLVRVGDSPQCSEINRAKRR
jgi:hypothetical protein